MSERMESLYKENYLLNRLFVLLTSVHSSLSFNSLWSGPCLGEQEGHSSFPPLASHHHSKIQLNPRG